jgi:putative FMN-dependent luciferase-like monooxygenase
MGTRLGLFTRLLGPSPQASPARVYADAIEQFTVAEQLGYDIGWVAQHHFDPRQGGLPSPLVFLAAVAARTERIRLGTGIITLALEDPIRVAEDAAVLDALSGGRLELGLGSGGDSGAFAIVNRHRPSATRSATYRTAVARLLDVLAGQPLAATGARLHPDGARLLTDVWQATFSPSGATRIGRAGSGLLLSRHQPRRPQNPLATLAEIQQPVAAAYLDALPPGARPRVGASRSVLVGRDSARLCALADDAAPRLAAHLRRVGHPILTGDHGPHTTEALLTALDVHVGTPEELIDSLASDPVVTAATDLIMQVHPIDPGQKATLESLELIATEVAPALGWRPSPSLDHIVVEPLAPASPFATTGVSPDSQQRSPVG